MANRKKSRRRLRRKSKRKSRRKSRKRSRRKSRKSRRKSRRKSKRKSRKKSRRKSRRKSKRKSKRKSRKKTVSANKYHPYPSYQKLAGKTKYEKCVLLVKAKQPNRCWTTGGKWKGGDKCYNPWAVCARLKEN